MLENMRFAHQTAGAMLVKIVEGAADRAAKDAALYMHPRLAAVAVGGNLGQSAETRNVSMAELARRIAFIFREAAREGQVIEAVEYQEVKPSDIN